MPGSRLSVRKIKEIARLRFELKRTHREIALACRVSPSTVGDTLTRLQVAGLSWPLPADLGDEALEERLYRVEPCDATSRPLPDWTEVHRELRRKGVTLALLWQEYRAANSDGFEYSWYCQNYAEWRGRLQLVMRQSHKLGEKVFVDYAGDTIPVYCSATGEVRQAKLFVGVLGGSSYTYVEAGWGEDLTSWTTAPARMFAIFGGVPEVAVPDNLKSGVTKPNFYDPEINPTYGDLADHYGIAVIPARPRKPRDKAKVEGAVLLVERWISAVLRNRKFYDLAELNAAIAELRERLNEKPFRKLPGSRGTLFELEEKPLLRPLPAEPYVFAHRVRMKVYLDYHVEVEGYHFSVPHRLVKQLVDVRYTATFLEVFFRGQRVASHIRNPHLLFSTLPEHMPANHRWRAEWTPERFQALASKFGPATEAMTTQLLTSAKHPEQAFRLCLGLLQHLGTRYDSRLEAACARALAVGAHSYRSVESILERGLDRLPLPGKSATVLTAGFHENVRGPNYYN